MRLFLIGLFIFLTACSQPQQLVEHSNWAEIFEQFDATGTLVIADERQAHLPWSVFNIQRSSQRFTPASTYKIPHTIFALDASVTNDTEVFRWNGVEHSFAGHNQDQTLALAMKNSTVWVYEELAQRLGDDRTKQYLANIYYGNANTATENGNYWIDGELAISAQEQITFLKQLYHNALPFQQEHQALVKKLILLETHDLFSIHAKTGWSGQVGWWVGWVDLADGPIFFALNIDTPHRLDDLYKREAIVRAVLQTMGILPS